MGEEYYNTDIVSVIASPDDDRDYTLNSLVTSSESTLPASYRVSVSPPLFSQGSTGCCVACALASCRYIQESLQEGTASKFSVNYIYGNRLDTDIQDECMIPRQALRTLLNFGDCHWDDFNGYNVYATAKSKYEANKETFDDLAYPYKINSYYRLYTTDEIKTAVYNLGCAIVVYDVTDYLRSPVDGYVTYDADTIVGQHCMTIVGWTEDDHWIVLNSWGTSYGIDGYCYVPFDYPINESWTMIDELRYKELTFERDYDKVANVYFGIKRSNKKRYLA